MASSVRLLSGARCGAEHLIHGRTYGDRFIIPTVSAVRTVSSASKASKLKKKQAAAAAQTKSTKLCKQRFPIHTAIEIVKKNAKAKFDETIEAAVVLNVDPRKQNQAVRGLVQLPKGTGKKVRVAVFARGKDAEAAKAAGADLVGAEDLTEEIANGNINFDKCIATPEVMGAVGRVARILGPRSLMPNTKMGTVTKDVVAGIAAAKQGQAEIRARKNGVLHLGIGKVSFSSDDLMENVRAMMLAISNLKPEVIKGQYIKQMHLSSTMGEGVGVDVPYINPASNRFMHVELDAESMVQKALEAQSDGNEQPGQRQSSASA